jgi:hypothetical protein
LTLTKDGNHDKLQTTNDEQTKYRQPTMAATTTSTLRSLGSGSEVPAAAHDSNSAAKVRSVGTTLAVVAVAVVLALLLLVVVPPPASASSSSPPPPLPLRP